MSLETYLGYTAVLFGVFGSLAYIKQIHLIYKDGSVESVSGTWTIAFCTGFISFLIYGIQQQSLPMEIQGWFRVSLSLLVVVGYFYFGSVNYRHWLLLTISLVLLLVMFFLPDLTYLLFIVLSLWAVISLFFQANEIHNNRTRGSVSVELQVLFALTGVTWLLYSSFREDIPLMIISAIAVCANGVVIHAWFDNY